MKLHRILDICLFIKMIFVRKRDILFILIWKLKDVLVDCMDIGRLLLWLEMVESWLHAGFIILHWYCMNIDMILICHMILILCQAIEHSQTGTLEELFVWNLLSPLLFYNWLLIWSLNVGKVIHLFNINLNDISSNYIIIKVYSVLIIYKFRIKNKY